MGIMRLLEKLGQQFEEIAGEYKHFDERYKTFRMLKKELMIYMTKYTDKRMRKYVSKMLLLDYLRHLKPEQLRAEYPKLKALLKEYMKEDKEDWEKWHENP